LATDGLVFHAPHESTYVAARPALPGRSFLASDPPGERVKVVYVRDGVRFIGKLRRLGLGKGCQIAQRRI
jgi:hypothetical protein